MQNTKMVPKSYKIKANIVYFCIFVIFSVLLYQLVRVQITDHEKYSSLAFSQQFKKLDIPARRGLIFDRNGLKLAESIQVNSVFADPILIQEKEKTARVISEVLGMSKKKVFNLLNREKRFVWIKRRIADEQADVIRQLNLQGIEFRQEYKRVYPFGKLCSHVLGFTDVDENGLAGIEGSFNQVVSGSNGYKIVGKDGHQQHFSTLKGETVSARYGNSVFLTIDCKIQSIVEDELENACLRWKPDSAIAIAMDPSTGEVLAMANYPSFDPNSVQNSEQQERRNRAITDCFEPGSLIKPLIVSSALDCGLVNESEQFFCHNGAYKVRRRIIRDDHSYDYLSVSDIVVHSSNIGMVQLGMLMGSNRLYNCLKDFSFGEKTGIQLPGETSGILRPLKRWTPDSAISISFGYETAVTPIQLVTAFCSLANGGTLLKPQIVSKITDYSGKKVKKEFDVPERIRRVVSPMIAREVMSPILENVVKEGTGKEAMLLTYRVAGKTGTAKQLEKVGNKMQYTDKYIGSFVGYAPVGRPKVCVLVSLNKPKNGKYYGGTVAAPAVGTIIERTLDYMKVEPQYVQMVQR